MRSGYASGWLFGIGGDGGRGGNGGNGATGLAGDWNVDYGNGFDDNEAVEFSKMRKAVGFEARWISPFGPLRAAYGINLDPRPTERTGVFEFTIGSLF